MIGLENTPANMKIARKAALAVKKITKRTVTIKNCDYSGLTLCIGYTTDRLGDRAFRKATDIAPKIDVCAEASGAGITTVECM